MAVFAAYENLPSSRFYDFKFMPLDLDFFTVQHIFSYHIETAHRGRGGLPGCSPPPKPSKTKLKNTEFVNIMISKVLRNLPFSRNQPLKSADG
jgi:hypothetical protein